MFPKIINKSLDLYRDLRRYYHDLQRSSGHQVKLFNAQIVNLNNHSVFEKSSVQSHWLNQFISNRVTIPKNKSLSIFGVNGTKFASKINQSNYKIFYTIENVHVKQSTWIDYNNLLLDCKNIDLSLGFDYIDHPQYIRFPYWLMTTFSSSANYESIKSKCNEINKIQSDFMIRKKFCAFICRADYFGDRGFFADQISKIATINFPGTFRHNDDDKKMLYNDNKLDYLRQFKFNLCPENSNNEGYVTEKIFDALTAGCIPIYWGANNQPEPNIINKNAVFF